jgi:hypothetical protein
MMHPELERQMAVERVKELRRAGAVARVRAATPPAPREYDIVIRLARPEDCLAVAALAVLDGADEPRGRTIVAEVDGSIAAALPLDDPDGGAFADPFRRTADIVALLEARAKQLAGERDIVRGGRLAWLARLV